MIDMLAKQTGRNMKVFLREKSNVFFAPLTPLIAIGLYLMFLGKLQSDGISSELAQAGIAAQSLRKDIDAFLVAWIASSATTLARITVPLVACAVEPQDRSRGICDDMLASPIPKWLPPVAYFLSTLLSALVICLIVLGACMVWATAAGARFASASDAFALIGAVALSIVASTLIFVLVASFIKTVGAFSGLNVIIGTASGFVAGAYVPISMLGTAAQSVCLVAPDTE